MLMACFQGGTERHSCSQNNYFTTAVSIQHPMWTVYSGIKVALFQYNYSAVEIGNYTDLTKSV